MNLKNKTILLISPEAWGTSFVSKHHYAVHLANRGNKVYFLNPPGNKYNLQKVNDNLLVIGYKPFIRGTNRLPIALRKTIFKKDIKRIKHLVGIEMFDVVWSFDPYRFQDLTLFKAALSIYHSVDVHHCTTLEKQIANSATIVLAVSDKILARLNTLTPKYKINHGLNDSFTAFEFNSITHNNTRPRIGYAGNLQSSFLDTVTLNGIIAANPQWEFHFIGPYTQSNLAGSQINKTFIASLKKQPHCILHGVVTAKKLPSYLSQYDVLLICYREMADKSFTSNSHKIIEYLATGRAVVSTYIDEYFDKPHLVSMVEKNSELPEKLDEVIANLTHYNSPEKQQARRAWALANTYEKQIERIESLLNHSK